MAQWDNYSTKAAPADSDTMMIKDNAATGKPNKRVLFSGLWDWIVSKLANAVISSLTTSPKTVTGGMNALQTAVTTLNSNTTPQIKTVSYTAGENINIRSLTCVKMGKLVELNFYFDVTERVANNAHLVDITDGLPKPIGKYAIGTARNVDGSFTLVSLEGMHNTFLHSWGATPVGTYYYAKLLYITDEE